MTETLYVRNLEQAAAWLELDGQISDGMWENARPNDHYLPWCRARVVVSPANPGRNFYARKDNYDFASRELLDVVGLRMLATVRIARALGLKAAECLEHVAECDGTIDWTREWHMGAVNAAAEVLGINSIEVRNRVDAAIADQSYGMADLKRDLADLKKIVRVFRA